MNLISLIQKYIDQIKDYFRNETDLIRLKLIRAMSIIAANVFAAVFIITMLNITLALLGVWLGFLISEYLDSYSIGFGLAGLSYLLILTLIIIFRKPLLIRPFTNISIVAMQELRLDEEDPESK